MGKCLWLREEKYVILQFHVFKCTEKDGKKRPRIYPFNSGKGDDRWRFLSSFYCSNFKFSVINMYFFLTVKDHPAYSISSFYIMKKKWKHLPKHTLVHNFCAMFSTARLLSWKVQQNWFRTRPPNRLHVKRDAARINCCILTTWKATFTNPSLHLGNFLIE